MDPRSMSNAYMTLSYPVPAGGPRSRLTPWVTAGLALLAVLTMAFVLGMAGQEDCGRSLHEDKPLCEND